MTLRADSPPGWSDLVDPQLLALATVPPGFAPAHRRIVFLWQVPSRAALAFVCRRLPDTPILLSRFRTEAPVREAGLHYWSPASFLPLSALIRLDQIGMEARASWAGRAEPSYKGMPLLDGDVTRTGVWSQMVATVVTLLAIRQRHPDVQVYSDWMGCRIARASGLKVRRLWRADLHDPNWPARRWLREHSPRRREGGRFAAEHLARVDGPNARPDVLFFIGHWVESRLLASFPVEPVMAEGLNCAIWAHKRSEALNELVARTGVPCLDIDMPEPAQDAGDLSHEVRRWCADAVAGGYFAPLRGNLARTAVSLMLWPAWARKLMAMHQLLSTLLGHLQPGLLVAAAEKDWSPYCAHYAARYLGIPSVGIKHGIWVPGTDLQQLDHRYHRPLTAPRVLAYTPGDAALWSNLHGIEPGRVIWQGNVRLAAAPSSSPEEASPARLLIAVRGMGEGHAMSLRHTVLQWNILLIEAMYKRLGGRVRVRLHPWDSAENYPAHVRSLILPRGEDLGEQLRRSAGVVTTYSNVVLDAAAAGRPVFQWDHERLNLERSEVAAQAAAVVATDLEALTESAAAFLDDPIRRQDLQRKAARFPVYLRRHSPGGDLTGAVTRWLHEQIAPQQLHQSARQTSSAAEYRPPVPVG